MAAAGMDIDNCALPIINIHKEEFKHTMAVQAILTGSVLTNEDAQTDPRLSSFKKSIQNNPYHSSAVVPFKRGGKVVGALGIVSTQAGDLKAGEELALLTEMGMDISFVLDTMENDRIKQQWADAFEHSAHGMVIGDVHTNRILACNPAFAREQGATIQELIDLPLRDMYRPEDQERIKELIAQSDREGRGAVRGSQAPQGWQCLPLPIVPGQRAGCEWKPALPGCQSAGHHRTQTVRGSPAIGNRAFPPLCQFKCRWHCDRGFLWQDHPGK